MDKLQKYNNKLLAFGNKLFKFNPPIYNVIVLPTEHGSISAAPVTGYSGTEIVLSNLPDTDYQFSSYSVTGANLYDGNKFKLFKSDVTVQGNFIESGYKRFMWRFDGTISGTGFQMSRIKINSVSLPYTYITYGANFNNWSSTEIPQNMVKSEDSVSGNNEKWGGNANSSSGYGWIIFDLSTDVVPTKYSLMTAGDTAQIPSRNPKRIRLYASTGTPTTFDDSSWVLLDDRSNALPAANHVWTQFTLNQI